MWRDIRYRAVAISLFAFFVLPFLLFSVLRHLIELSLGDDAMPGVFQAAVVLLWIWMFGPLGAGYLAAKLARTQALWHGFLVGTLAAAFQALFFRSELWWVWVGLVVLAISCAVFGAWLWRYRATGVA